MRLEIDLCGLLAIIVIATAIVEIVRILVK